MQNFFGSSTARTLHLVTPTMFVFVVKATSMSAVPSAASDDDTHDYMNQVVVDKVAVRCRFVFCAVLFCCIRYGKALN